MMDDHMMVSVSFMNREIERETERCVKIVEQVGRDDGNTGVAKLMVSKIREETPLPERPKRVPFVPLSR